MTFKHALKRKLYFDIVAIISMFSYHFIFSYMVFGSIKWSIVHWFFIRMCDSTWFIWVAQSNHIVMDVHDDEGKESWLSLQVSFIKILGNYSINALELRVLKSIWQ